MHVGEETFHSIRMNPVEYATLKNDFAKLLEDNEISDDDLGLDYPILYRFFSVIEALTGVNDITPIIPETPLTDDDDEAEEMIDDGDDPTTA